jgi:hypothetical protein
MDSTKVLRTILIVLIAGVAISGLVDTRSQQYAQQSLNRALVTFAAARTLNGVISVAQGTEVAIEPGGLGVILTPGQVLDPVNDLVERFSSLMLVAASSLGLQIMLLKITSSWGVTALLVASVAAWLAFAWSRRLKNNKYFSLAVRLTLILTFVRFAVPVIIICSSFMFSTFLQNDQESATAALEETFTAIEEVSIQYDDLTKPDTVPSQNDDQALSDETDESIMDRVRSAYKSTQDFGSDIADWFGSVNVAARMVQLKNSATSATSHIVDLIVIFVLQTIIFPLGFLWIFVEVLKAAATRTISVIGIQKSPL